MSVETIVAVSTAAGSAAPSAKPSATSSPVGSLAPAIDAKALPSSHRWGVAIAGVTTRLPLTDTPRMALTLDACGGPGGDGYDADLIALLEERRIAATLFMTARWIDKHPDEAASLASKELFEIENHGTRHRPCSVSGRPAFGIPGTASVEAAREEIWNGRLAIQSLTGRTPRFYRPGTGFFDAPCVGVVEQLGARAIGFTVSGDGGAGYSRAQVRRALVRAPDGAIVLLHMNKPRSAIAAGVGDALSELGARGVHFVRLSEAFEKRKK